MSDNPLIETSFEGELLDITINDSFKPTELDALIIETSCRYKCCPRIYVSFDLSFVEFDTAGRTAEEICYHVINHRYEDDIVVDPFADMTPEQLTEVAQIRHYVSSLSYAKELSTVPQWQLRTYTNNKKFMKYSIDYIGIEFPCDLIAKIVKKVHKRIQQ